MEIKRSQWRNQRKNNLTIEYNGTRVESEPESLMPMRIRLTGQNEKISKEVPEGIKIWHMIALFREKTLVQERGNVTYCSQVQRKTKKYLTWSDMKNNCLRLNAKELNCHWLYLTHIVFLFSVLVQSTWKLQGNPHSKTHLQRSC